MLSLIVDNTVRKKKLNQFAESNHSQISLLLKISMVSEGSGIIMNMSQGNKERRQK